jgi:hypothetical protein
MNLEELMERLTSVLFALISAVCLTLTIAHSSDAFVPYVTGAITLIAGLGCWATWKTKDN